MNEEGGGGNEETKRRDPRSFIGLNILRYNQSSCFFSSTIQIVNIVIGLIKNSVRRKGELFITLSLFYNSSDW